MQATVPRHAPNSADMHPIPQPFPRHAPNPADMRYIYFITNRLDTYFNGTMDMSAGAPANFRVFKFDTGIGSSSSGGQSEGIKTIVIMSSILLSLVAVYAAIVYIYPYINKKRSPHALEASPKGVQMQSKSQSQENTTNPMQAARGTGTEAGSKA